MIPVVKEQLTKNSIMKTHVLYHIWSPVRRNVHSNRKVSHCKGYICNYGKSQQWNDPSFENSLVLHFVLCEENIVNGKCINKKLRNNDARSELDGGVIICSE